MILIDTTTFMILFLCIVISTLIGMGTGIFIGWRLNKPNSDNNDNKEENRKPIGFHAYDNMLTEVEEEEWDDDGDE